jgi:translation initiation factor IF-3
MIRVPQVRVVDDEGQQLGVMPTPQALAMAQERGLDLVEVAPTAAPPVVRFLDFGQYKYELTKREKEAKRKQRAVEFKEVRLTPKIGQGDFDTKTRQIAEFLGEGHKVKVTIMFRGREVYHPELGMRILEHVAENVASLAKIEASPKLDGRNMTMVLAPDRKAQAAKKEHAAAKDENREDNPAERPAEPADETAAQDTPA